MRPTRRCLLTTILAVPPLLLLQRVAFAQAQSLSLPLTPSCGEPAQATVRQTAGPFYTPDAPLKRDLASDVEGGRPMTLAGFVVDQQCQPVVGAMVEIWHADENGEYDSNGFRLRGHQFTDAEGRWGFTTVETQHYAFRTAHYHFNVRRLDGALLTTQLYFPDHPRNGGDRLFDPRLVLHMRSVGTHRIGQFDFVI